MGVQIDKTAAHGNRLVGLQLGIRRDDFVLMNTTAVREYYQRHILEALRDGALRHAFWYVHEEPSQLTVTAPDLLEPERLGLVKQLVEAGALTVIVPSLRTKIDYDRLLDTDKVRTVSPRLEVDEGYLTPRRAEEYDELHFLMVGGGAGGRKGQLIALAAMQEFLLTQYAADPSRYRQFTLTMVGLDDSHISRQIRSVGSSVLGERLVIFPQVTPGEVLEIARGCNAVLCSSLIESFALYVAEGMAMGHVVLRSDTAGTEEQLRDGVNGFQVDIADTKQFAGVIACVLDRESTPNERLQAMGQASQEMIEPFRHGSYRERLESLERPTGVTDGGPTADLESSLAPSAPGCA